MQYSAIEFSKIKVRKLNQLQQAFNQWAFKDTGKRWGWNRRGCVLKGKKRGGVKIHHSALTLEGPAFIILLRRSPCTRAGYRVVLGLPRQRSLQVDYTETCIRQHTALRHLFDSCVYYWFENADASDWVSLATLYWSSALGWHTVSEKRLYERIDFFVLSRWGEVMKERTCEAYCSPNGAQGKFCCVREHLRMYLYTSVQVTCCTGCFLLHWTASCSSSPGTVNSLLETAACCL